MNVPICCRTLLIQTSVGLSVRRSRVCVSGNTGFRRWQQQLATTSVVGRAVLHSEAELGGRAWLAAVPSGRKRLEAAAFVVELRQRLGLADASADVFCPCCEGVLDRFSLHAGTCVAGGERNQRHNAVRDLRGACGSSSGA